MARPKQNITKNKRLSVGCTDRDYQKIREKAAQSKQSVSEYLLNSGLCKEIIVPQPKSDIDTVTQLIRIGTNLNQLTRAIQSGRASHISIDEVQQTFKDVNELIEYIRK